MIQISANGPLDSSGRQRMATNALLGVLAAFVLAQLAPWGDLDTAATVMSVLLGAAGGLVIGRFIRPNALVWLDVALVAVYVLVAWTPIVSPLTSRWVRIDPLPADTLDAVVVLSAGTVSDSALNSIGADRLLSGLELMRAGRARRLVTTQVILKKGSRTVTSDSDQTRLITLAAMTNRWTIVTGATNTRGEAVGSADILLPKGQKTIAVVTSPMHTRRACKVFEAVGFKVYCRASLERDHVTNPPSGKLDRLAALRAYGYELMGMVKYGARGWLAPGAVVTHTPGGSS